MEDARRNLPVLPAWGCAKKWSAGEAALPFGCPSSTGGVGVEATTRDLALIGGGPGGLYAAFYAGLRGMSVSLFEALPFLGGQVAALYPEKAIFDIGGFPRIGGAELVARLEEQALQADPDLHLGEEVTGLERDAAGVRLTTARGEYRARAVLLTTGVGRFTPRPLGVPAVDGWHGSGVTHTLRQAERFGGQPCLVVGGGDSALDWAAELAEAGARVTVVHRRDQFRAVEASLRRAEACGVTLRRSCTLETIRGVQGPESVVLRDLRSGAREELACAAVVLALGYTADLSALRSWGLPLDGRGVLVTPDTMAVAPGVYAAGDIASYPGKLKLIATAFAEAALAVSACKQGLDPASRFQAGHSSDHTAGAPAISGRGGGDHG